MDIEDRSVEIERKWVISNFDDVHQSIDPASWQNIRQAYMGPTARVRINGVTPERDSSSVISIKLSTSRLSCDEFNYPIPMEDAELFFEAHPNMEKDRVSIGNGFTLDIFKGRLEGLFLIEKEYASEDEAMNDEIPLEWNVIEVTGDDRYFNAALVNMSFDSKIGLFVDDPAGFMYDGEKFPPEIFDDRMLENLLVTGDEEDLGIDKPLIIK